MLTSDQKKNLVLIVDDVEQNVTVLSQVLRDAGMNVIAAFSGEQALRLVEKRLPDLILLDVMMPGMDGIETCKQLKQRERTADIPVIFLSALSETDTKVRGLETGAVDYIAKPFNEREVVARVSVHLTIRNLQQERSDNIRQLERLNNEKDRLMRILSHDLRSPLGGINGLATILRDSDEAKNETTVRHFSKVICQSSEHLLSLVSDLLDLAAIESGNIELHLQSFDIIDELRSAIDLMSYMASAKGITLSLETYSDVCTVKADKQKITQIVNNIVTNAIKFTKDGSVTVSVSTKEVSSGALYLILDVKDTGIGISKENIEILFEQFGKHQRLGTNNEKGTGLGMSIVKRFTELHQGTVSVVSEVGIGTTITLALPILDIEEHPAGTIQHSHSTYKVAGSNHVSALST